MRSKKMGKVLCAGLLCLALLLGIRIYKVNSSAEKVPVQQYGVGDVVPFEKDFNDNSDDNAEGYTLQVLDTEVLSVEDFAYKYNLSEMLPEGEQVQYYYLVKIACGNEDNTQGEAKGISLDLVSLVGPNYYMELDGAFFELLNPGMPGTSFSLQPDTSKEMVLPYAVTESVHTDYEGLTKDKLNLQLTEYPHRKLIGL